MPATDAVLRYAVPLEGLSVDTARLINADLADALSAIEGRLTATLADDAPLTAARLQAQQGEIAALQRALSNKIAGRVDDALGAVVETSPAAAKQAVEALGVELSTTAIPVEALAATATQPFDGRGWTAWGRKLSDDTFQRLNSEIRQAVTLGEPIRDVRKRFQRVTNLSRHASERLARTAINSTANRARIEAINRAAGDAVAGWRYTSVLDGSTSSTCQGLDGQVFKKDDPAIPAPPRHPNCRSTLVPVGNIDEEVEGQRPFVRSEKSLRKMGPEFRRQAKARVGEKRWKGLSEKQRRVEIAKTRGEFQRRNVGQVPAKTTYDSWLRKQPKTFQREVLGPVRAKAFDRGLDLGKMATVDRPLSIAELKTLYPRELAP